MGAQIRPDLKYQKSTYLRWIAWDSDRDDFIEGPQVSLLHGMESIWILNFNGLNWELEIVLVKDK